MLQKENSTCCGSTEQDRLCEYPPAFRLVILSDGITTMLVCRDCLTDAIEDMPETLLLADRHDPPVPELAYMVLPPSLTEEQVKLLRQEITEEIQESPALRDA